MKNITKRTLENWRGQALKSNVELDRYELSELDMFDLSVELRKSNDNVLKLTRVLLDLMLVERSKDDN